MSDLEDVGMQVEFISYPPDGGVVELRQIALGHQPLIIIEPRWEEGLLVLSITASMLSENAAEVADALATFALAFRKSVDQSGGNADE